MRMRNFSLCLNQSRNFPILAHKHANKNKVFCLANHSLGNWIYLLPFCYLLSNFKIQGVIYFQFLWKMICCQFRFAWQFVLLFLNDTSYAKGDYCTHTHHNIERKRIAMPMTLKSLVNPKTASILLFVFQHFFFPKRQPVATSLPNLFIFIFREKQLPIIRSLTLPSFRPSHSFLSLIVAGMHAVQQRRAKGGERASFFGKVVRRMDAFLSVWETRRIAAAVSRAVEGEREIGDFCGHRPMWRACLGGWEDRRGYFCGGGHVSREWVSPI